MFLTSPTLASLRFFEAAARLSSFKKAAAELHVTQGAVSQQIKHLEGALGCKLFYRLPRQLVLTDEGRQFAGAVEQALDAIRREAERIIAGRSPIKIRVRAGPSFALHWLVPRLADFHARHPQIRLFISAAYGYFEPARREFDLAIEMTATQVATLRTETLMNEYLIPVCTADYLAKHEFLKKPADLSRCTLLHDSHAWVGEAEDAEWRHWLNAVGATEVDSTQGQFFSLANLSIEAALTHQGVAMGRAALVKELLEEGQLIAPFKQRIESPMKYCLLYPDEIAERPGMQLVIRWLHEQAAKSFT